jgi:type VI secretion system secreted protein VgrG
MPDTNYVKVDIDPDPGFKFDFDGLTGTEELGRPFVYDLRLASGTPQGDLTTLLGSKVCVTINTAGGDKRYFNGIIAQAVFAGMSGGAYVYRIQFRPWIWLLSQVQDCKIFQNKSAFDIIQAVFSSAGFTDVSDKRQNQAGSQVLDYCVQYRETSLDFVTRLMELWGIYYYFTHSDSAHTLVFADDPNSHSSISGNLPFRIREVEYRRVEDHIWQWASQLSLMPGAATLRDYNFTTPAADLTSKSIKAGGHPYGNLEIYDYPGPYGTTDVGQKLAAVRQQNFTSRLQIRSGMTNCRAMYTGSKFTMAEFVDDAQNDEHLVIGASYEVSAAEGKSDTGGQLMDTFTCSFNAIPGTVPFKLDPITPRPIVRGPQTAIVVGSSGDEITTDQYGRIKVQFYWDRIGLKDQNSSCWCRVAQIWAGQSWGAMFIPRIGQEVVVDFLEGDPDRPIITGSVYNATVTVPYTLPDNKTRSTIKSNSSLGGGGFNELRFEDKKGSEEVFFQAQKDYNKVVLNNETVKITQDTTTTVDKGNRSVTVSKGNNSLTVSTGNDSTTISQGNHSITVSAGTCTIEAAQSITLKVGGNSIVIDTSGVTVTAAKVSITAQGQGQFSAGGPLTLAGATVAIN